MKKIIRLSIFMLILVLGINFVFAAECGSVPVSGCEITVDTTFTPGTYVFNDGIYILGDNLILDMNGATIQGGSLANDNFYAGIYIGNTGGATTRYNITIKNGYIIDWHNTYSSAGTGGGVGILNRDWADGLTLENMYFDNNDIHDYAYNGRYNFLVDQSYYGNLYVPDQSAVYNFGTAYSNVRDGEIKNSHWDYYSGTLHIPHQFHSFNPSSAIQVHDNIFSGGVAPGGFGTWYNNIFNYSQGCSLGPIFPTGDTDNPLAGVIMYNNTFDGCGINQNMRDAPGDGVDFYKYIDGVGYVGNTFLNGATYQYWPSTPDYAWDYNGHLILGDFWAGGIPTSSITINDASLGGTNTTISVTLLVDGLGHWTEWYLDGVLNATEDGVSYTYTGLNPGQEYNITAITYTNESISDTYSTLKVAEETCTSLFDDMVISDDVTVCSGTHYATNIHIASGATVTFEPNTIIDATHSVSNDVIFRFDNDGGTLDCNDGKLIGPSSQGSGVQGVNSWGYNDLTVENCDINYVDNIINTWWNENNLTFRNIYTSMDSNAYFHGGGSNAVIDNVHSTWAYLLGYNQTIINSQFQDVYFGHDGCGGGCPDAVWSGEFHNNYVSGQAQPQQVVGTDYINISGNFFDSNAFAMYGNPGSSNQFVYGNVINGDWWDDSAGDGGLIMCVDGVGNLLLNGGTYNGPDSNGGDCPAGLHPPKYIYSSFSGSELRLNAMAYFYGDVDTVQVFVNDVLEDQRPYAFYDYNKLEGITPDQEYNITFVVYDALANSDSVTGTIVASAVPCSNLTAWSTISEDTLVCSGEHIVTNINVNNAYVKFEPGTTVRYDEGVLGTPDFDNYWYYMFQMSNSVVDCADGLVDGYFDSNQWNGHSLFSLNSGNTVQNCRLGYGWAVIDSWYDNSNNNYYNLVGEYFDSDSGNFIHGGGTNAHFDNVSYMSGLFMGYDQLIENSNLWYSSFGHSGGCCTDAQWSGTVTNSVVDGGSLDNWNYNDYFNFSYNYIPNWFTIYGGSNGQQFFYGNDVYALDDWTDYGGGDYIVMCSDGTIDGDGNTYTDGYYGGHPDRGTCPAPSCIHDDLRTGCKWDDSGTLPGGSYDTITNTYTTTGNIEIDCAGTTFIGNAFGENFIDILNDNVTLKNCNFQSYQRIANINANDVVFDNINDQNHDRTRGCLFGCSQSDCVAWNPDTTEQQCTDWYGAEYWIGGECQHSEQCWQCGGGDNLWACPYYDEIAGQDQYWYDASNWYEVGDITTQGRNVVIKNSYIEGDTQLQLSTKYEVINDGDYCAQYSNLWSNGDAGEVSGSTQIIEDSWNGGGGQVDSIYSFTPDQNMNVHGLVIYIDSVNDCGDGNSFLDMVLSETPDWGGSLNWYSDWSDTTEYGRQKFFEGGSSYLNAGQTYYLYMRANSGGCGNYTLTAETMPDSTHTGGTLTRVFDADGCPGCGGPGHGGTEVPLNVDLRIEFITDDSNADYVPDSGNCYYWDYDTNGATEEECAPGFWNSGLARCEDPRFRYAGGNCVPWGPFNSPSCSDQWGLNGWNYYGGDWYECNVDDVSDLNFQMINTIVNRTDSQYMDHTPFPWISIGRGAGVYNSTWYYPGDPEGSTQHEIVVRFSGEDMEFAGNTINGGKSISVSGYFNDYSYPERYDCPSINTWVHDNELNPTRNGLANEVTRATNTTWENNIITGINSNELMRIGGLPIGSYVGRNLTAGGVVVRNNQFIVDTDFLWDDMTQLDDIYSLNRIMISGWDAPTDGIEFYNNSLPEAYIWGGFPQNVEVYGNDIGALFTWGTNGVDLCKGGIGNTYQHGWVFNPIGPSYSNWVGDWQTYEFDPVCDYTIPAGIVVYNDFVGQNVSPLIDFNNAKVTSTENNVYGHGPAIYFRGYDADTQIVDATLRNVEIDGYQQSVSFGSNSQRTTFKDSKTSDPYYEYGNSVGTNIFQNLDVPAPVFTASETPASTLNTFTTPEISYTVETIAQLSNCTLLLNGNIFDTKTGFDVNTKSASYEISMPGLAVRSHAWSLVCTDVFGNEVVLDDSFSIKSGDSGASITSTAVAPKTTEPAYEPPTFSLFDIDFDGNIGDAIDNVRDGLAEAAENIQEEIKKGFQPASSDGESQGAGSNTGVALSIAAALVGIGVISMMSKP